MKRLFLAVVYFLLNFSCLASVNKVSGQIDLTRGSTKGGNFEFSVETISQEGVSVLKIWRKNFPKNPEYQFVSEPGDVFLNSVTIESLSRSSGDLLFVYWERGASGIWLTVIGLKADNKVGVVFESSSHGGYKVIDIEGRGERRIVEVLEGYAAKEFTSNIYGYSSAGVIELISTKKAKTPHFYSLNLNNPDDFKKP